MSLFESEMEIKIPFHDLDPMNVVWHGNYVKYMEQARCDMLDKLGYGYYEMKDDNYAYPVAKMKTKYIKSLYFNQEIIAKAFLEAVEPSVIIKYKFYDKKTGEEVFCAETMQIGVNILTGESLYNAPAKMLEKLGLNNEK